MLSTRTPRDIGAASPPPGHGRREGVIAPAVRPPKISKILKRQLIFEVEAGLTFINPKCNMEYSALDAHFDRNAGKS